MFLLSGRHILPQAFAPEHPRVESAIQPRKSTERRTEKTPSEAEKEKRNEMLEMIRKKKYVSLPVSGPNH